MSGLALMFGLIFLIGAVLIAVIITVLVLRRRSATHVVPPPIDPGPPQPEQARDLNAEK